MRSLLQKASVTNLLPKIDGASGFLLPKIADVSEFSHGHLGHLGHLAGQRAAEPGPLEFCQR
jgi:hypothetical protein